MNFDIVGISEIAEDCGVSKQAVNNWRSRFDDWPEPVAELKMGAIYWWLDVTAFLLRHPRLADPERITVNRVSAKKRLG
jgi:hypothetical protein